MRFEITDPENIVVDVHQILRDLSGNIVSIRNLQHIFQIDDGLIKKMGIQ